MICKAIEVEPSTFYSIDERRQTWYEFPEHPDADEFHEGDMIRFWEVSGGTPTGKHCVCRVLYVLENVGISAIVFEKV